METVKVTGMEYMYRAKPDGKRDREREGKETWKGQALRT